MTNRDIQAQVQDLFSMEWSYVARVVLRLAHELRARLVGTPSSPPPAINDSPCSPSALGLLQTLATDLHRAE